MVIPIVFAAVLSLLTSSSEKPLCCYATERGWIVYALGSPDIHVLRPHMDEGFVERTVLLSSKLAPSNLKNHKMAALVIDDRLVLEYAYDFGGGWLPRNGSIDTRTRGECSIKGLFDGKVVDQVGKSSSLFSKVVHNAITGDLLETQDQGVLGIHYYEADDKIRTLGWFKNGDLGKEVPPEEKFRLPCPFKGHFKCLRKKDRYYFVTDCGVLYTSSCDQDGKPQEIVPVFLGFREPVRAVVSLTRTKKTYIFTEHRYFELGDEIPSPKLLRSLKDTSYSKVDRIVDEISDRSNYLYYQMYLDKVIDPVKIDTK